MSTVILTGAAGFVGGKILAQLIGEGLEVIAFVRPGKASLSEKFDNIQTLEVDLSDTECFEKKLNEVLDEKSISAFIYASGSMNGDDEEHESHSIGPLRTIIRCMKHAPCKRLVHLSSLSVYGYSALPSGGVLDETTPLESELEYRDAYARAKCKQESLLMRAAQENGLRVTSLRLGMVYSGERTWSARLGIPFKKWLLIPNNNAQLPLAHVESCAAAVERTVQRTEISNDLYIPDVQNKPGAFEAVNVVDDVLPSVEEYLTLAEKYHLVKPLKKVSLPSTLLEKLVKVLSLIQIISPSLYLKIPNIFKIQTFDSRYKRIRFSNYRQKERLDLKPESWDQVLKREHLNAK